MRRLSPILLPLAVAACTWGTTLDEFPPARSAVGADVTIGLAGNRSQHRGELFAADSLWLYVRTDRLVRVPWARVNRLDVRGMGDSYDVVPGGPTDPQRWRRLALVSRFPQGMDDALLSRILAEMKQPAVQELP